MKKKKFILTTIIATATLAAGFLAGQLLPLDEILNPEQRESNLKPIPISTEISGEAREYCVTHGMTFSEIAADQHACLNEYWTIDRLHRSDRLQNDWDWDNGYYENHCGVTSSGAGFCDLIGAPDFPDEDDSWWDEQAVRDPGRTTKPGMSEDIAHTYDREEARAAMQAPKPVAVQSLALAQELIRWCAIEPDKYGYVKKTRAYTVAEIKMDVRPCLVDWFAR